MHLKPLCLSSLEGVKPVFLPLSSPTSVSAPQTLGSGLGMFYCSCLQLTHLCVHKPLTKGSPAPSLWRALASAAVPSFAGAGAVAQTIWFLTASQLSAPRCRVAVKLAAPVVSLHSACRKLLLEVVIPELPHRLQKYLLYPCVPFLNHTALKVSLFLLLITVSCFSFINPNIIAYLLWLQGLLFI